MEHPSRTLENLPQCACVLSARKMADRMYGRPFIGRCHSHRFSSFSLFATCYGCALPQEQKQGKGERVGEGKLQRKRETCSWQVCAAGIMVDIREDREHIYVP